MAFVPCAAVSYRGAQLIPVQTVSIDKTYERSEDGTKLGSRFQFVIEGTLISHMGSPRGTGLTSDPNWGGPDSMWWIGPGDADVEDRSQVNNFDHLLNKSEAIRKLFSVDGQLLEIQSTNATPPIRANVTINSVSFPAGNWVETMPYVINCEANNVIGEFNTGDGEDDFQYFINSANETWNIEFNQPENASQQYTYRLTHTINAKGKTQYEIGGTIEVPPWQYAKQFCQARLGYDATMATASGTLDLQNYLPFNHIRLDNLDELGGTYSVTESWVLATGSALEDFTVTSNTAITDPIRRVTIEGSIQGLDIASYTPAGISLTQSKWQSASGYFNNITGQLYERAYLYSQASQFPRALNMIAASTQINRNPVAGTINYSYQYDTRRPLCLSSNPNILSENITISDNGLTNTIAIISILGRAAGDILQDTRTKSHRTRTMSVDIIILPPTGCLTSALKIGGVLQQSPYYDVRSIFLSMDNYLRSLYDQVYIVQNDDSWSNDLSSYNRVVQWKFADCSNTGTLGVL